MAPLTQPARRRIHRTKLASFGFVLTAALLAGPATAQRGGALNGTWRGTLSVVSATQATPAAFWRVGDQPEFEIAISGKSATVRVKGKTWRELYVGDGFRVSSVDRSGIVSAQHVVDGYVEHWNLTVTKKSPDALLVFLSYVAGGSLDRIDKVTTEFAVGAMGELGRYDGPQPSGAGK